MSYVRDWFAWSFCSAHLRSRDFRIPPRLRRCILTCFVVVVLSGLKEPRGNSHDHMYVVFESLLPLVRLNLSEWEASENHSLLRGKSGVMFTTPNLPLIFPLYKRTSPSPVESYSSGDVLSARSELVLEVEIIDISADTKILQAKLRTS